ncbi:MAG: hypothetical protein ACOZNI_08415 [Myxococcota bacterium]
MAPFDTLDDPPTAFARWDDYDGDGVDDWLFADDSAPGDGTVGSVTVVLAVDFVVGPRPDGVASLVGLDGAGTGGTVAPVEDGDGDGLADVLTSLGDDAVVLASSAFGAETRADRAVRARFEGVGAWDVERLGDLDGGGAEELVFVAPTLWGACVARGEDGSLTCFDYASFPGFVAATLGPDADGVGVREVWVVTGDALSAWGVASALAGTYERVATRSLAAPPAGLAADATELWLLATRDNVRWREEEVAWRLPPQDVASGEPLATLVAGGWGGGVYQTSFGDVTGDGAEDLVLSDGLVWAFDGAGLARGGERTPCDAEWQVEGPSETRAARDGTDGEDVPVLDLVSAAGDAVWWAALGPDLTGAGGPSPCSKPPRRDLA